MFKKPIHDNIIVVLIIETAPWVEVPKDTTLLVYEENPFYKTFYCPECSVAKYTSKLIPEEISELVAFQKDKFTIKYDRLLKQNKKFVLKYEVLLSVSD
jgi:hypothetical protein